MGIRELSKWLEREPQEKGDTVTQEEAEYARELYVRHLNYLDCLNDPDPGIQRNPLNEEETEFLVDVIARMARQGKEIILPSKYEKQFLTST